jgi:hypothetical protein
MAQGSPSSGKLGTFAVAVVTLALIAGFGYLLLQAIDDAPEVAGAFVTALGVVATVIYGRAWEKSRELEQARRERIARTYSRMVEAFYNSIGSDAEHAEAELLGSFQEWAHKALLWAPAPVIRAFNEWRATLPEDGQEPPRQSASASSGSCSPSGMTSVTSVATYRRATCCGYSSRTSTSTCSPTGSYRHSNRCRSRTSTTAAELPGQSHVCPRLSQAQRSTSALDRPKSTLKRHSRGVGGVPVAGRRCVQLRPIMRFRGPFVTPSRYPLVALIRKSAAETRKTRVEQGFLNGSDGTRTRDLRRDRPAL